MGKPKLRLVTLALFCLIWAPSLAQAQKSPVTYLRGVLDQHHKTLDVYTDAHAAGNHFVARGRMSSSGDEDAVPTMQEAWTGSPYSRCTCIKASFKSKGSNWGGWYFMNGVLLGEETAPRENWGDYPNAGIDLRGATQLTFWARGELGGERVEFFVFGVGWSVETGQPVMPYPDSSKKLSPGVVTLSSQWRRYKLKLKGKDLSYVLGGFGWVASAEQNGDRDITFYLDDIKYNKPRLGDPRFLVSYQTTCSGSPFDQVMRNVAFTYDNAVTLLAFLASRDVKRARLLADALVYAQEYDRFYSDGRVRNAYQGGDLILFPGWTPHGKGGTVRMPGWYDTVAQQWYEDRFQVSTHTGNVAWAMLALLKFYQATEDGKYLTAAKRMGEWIETNCRDSRGAGGYTGGVEGWEPNPTKLLYKATEHNIDLLAAFRQLYVITGESAWLERSNHAKRFVLAMWDGDKFWTGTLDDGETINRSVVPVDVQAWGVLALTDEGEPYWGAVTHAESHHRVGSGYDFNQEDLDGIWFEGTAQMAVAHWYVGDTPRWRDIMSFLKANQDPSGGLWAADHDGLTTGFFLSNGEPWVYYRRLHVGATGWMGLALKKYNPF